MRQSRGEGSEGQLQAGYKRSKSNCYANCTLLKIDGVRTKEDTQFYIGKRVAYVYKVKKEVKHSKFRVMWGKIRRSHGNSGAVRAKFVKNIPPKAGPSRASRT
ncbi:RPL35AC [Symbiodinium necroappetens]|uniref:RPL35AC protein n=1 Tax=Symbiodinium necroappetens TaxID=1628268 RepID=A0A812YHN1_9DINO|nr:RPL35AC [Symbiodinium necroappetens]